MAGSKESVYSAIHFIQTEIDREGYPNRNLAYFVGYIKIVNTFFFLLRNKVIILK